MRRKPLAFAAACALMVFAVQSFLARADDLEPETGVFAGYGPPSPYELLLRRALFEDDNYRLCQFVVLPSFAAECAVYIVQPEKGSPVVVSRTLKRELWGAMMAELQNACPSGSFSLDAASESVALSKLRLTTETHRAELAPETLKTLDAVCRDVLLRVRYRQATTLGLDGTSYHMGHWIPGAFLSGTTWSPEPGTMAREFVELGEHLKLYAEARAEDRKQIGADLVARAGKIERRLGKSR